jgi:hypothetical protein
LGQADSAYQDIDDFRVTSAGDSARQVQLIWRINW